MEIKLRQSSILRTQVYRQSRCDLTLGFLLLLGTGAPGNSALLASQLSSRQNRQSRTSTTPTLTLHGYKSRCASVTELCPASSLKGQPLMGLCAFQFAEQAQSAGLGRPWSQHSQGGFLSWKEFAACCSQGGRMREAELCLVWQEAQPSRRSTRRSRLRSPRSESSSSRRGESTSSPTPPKVDLLLTAQNCAMQQHTRGRTMYAEAGRHKGPSVQLPASLPTVPISLP